MTASSPSEPNESAVDDEQTSSPRSSLAIGFGFTVGALLAVALAATVLAAHTILTVIVLALFLALGLNPVVEWLTRRRLPRAIAVVVVVLIAVVLFSLALWAIIPVAGDQLIRLVDDGPALLTAARDHPLVHDLDQRFGVVDALLSALNDPALADDLFGGVLGAGQLLVGVVTQGVALAVLTVWFLASMPLIKRAVRAMAPARRRDRVGELCDLVFDKVGHYVGGLFVIVTLAGTGTFILLVACGLGEYALALAVVVALLDFIPLVGPTIGAVIVATVVFLHSPSLGVVAVIYYLIYTQTEAWLIYPRVMSRSIDVPGVVTVTAALLGGTLLGIAGALVAIPTAAIALLMWQEVLQPRLDRS